MLYRLITAVWILQGQAEYYLEKLHGEVEKQLELFLKNQKTNADWRKFRETLIGLTDVTRSHFAKLVQVSMLVKVQHEE